MRVGQTSAIFFVARIVSSVAGFIATVYFTRTLDAELLGMYFLAIAVLIWASVVLGRPFQSAVTKRLSETDDTRYVTAGVLVQAGIFLVCFVLAIFFRGTINAYLGADAALALVGLLFLSFGFKLIVASLQGERRVHVAAMLDPVNVGARSIVQVTVVFMGFGLFGLFAGYGIGMILATVLGVGVLHSRPRLPSRRHFRRLYTFAQYAWIGKVSNRAFSSMDTVILGLFIAKGFIAYYEIAWNLASIFALFAVGISQTLFPEISKLSGEENMRQVESLVRDSLTFSGLFLIPGLVGSIVVGDLALRIYGPEYAIGWTVLVLLVAARLVYAYASQFTNALSAIDRPDLAFRVNAAFIAVNITLNVGLIYAIGWIGAAIATGISGVVSLILGYRYLADHVGVTIPVSELSKQWVAATAMGLIVAILREPMSVSWQTGVILAGLGAGIYFSLLYGLSTEFRTVLRDNFPTIGI